MVEAGEVEEEAGEEEEEEEEEEEGVVVSHFDVGVRRSRRTLVPSPFLLRRASPM